MFCLSSSSTSAQPVRNDSYWEAGQEGKMPSTSHAAAAMASCSDYSTNPVIPMLNPDLELLTALRKKYPAPSFLWLQENTLYTWGLCPPSHLAICPSPCFSRLQPQWPSFCFRTFSLRATWNLLTPKAFLLQIFPCWAPAYHFSLTLNVTSSQRYPVPLWEFTCLLLRINRFYSSAGCITFCHVPHLLIYSYPYKHPMGSLKHELD